MDKVENGSKSNVDYAGRINVIFDKYLNVISPFTTELQIVDGVFPTEILNEIRATFTHLAKHALFKSADDKNKNLVRAERHIERAILDCYKYLCHSYSGRYDRYKKENYSCDWGAIDNGDFNRILREMKKDAEDTFKKAMKSELEEGKESDVVNLLYKQAHNKFFALDEYINDEKNREKVQWAKRRNKTRDIVMTILAVTGWLGTIVGLILVLIERL